MWNRSINDEMTSQDTKPRTLEKTSSYTDQPLTCKSAVEGQNALSSLKTVSVYQESHNHFSQVMGNGFPIFLFSSTISSLVFPLILISFVTLRMKKSVIKMALRAG